MTLKELEVAIADANAAWHGPDGNPLMNPNQPTEVAQYRATLEVAYQLALPNQQLSRLRFNGGNLLVQTENASFYK